MGDSNDLAHRFTVDATPEKVFAAVNNVRAWWTGDIEGTTDQLGAEWTYRYKDFHFSKQKVTALVPGEKVVWEVVESQLTFVKDKTEWNGTTVVFDIAQKGEQTELRFTHVGLSRDQECFEACSDAWGSYIKKSLKALITTGIGDSVDE